MDVSATKRQEAAVPAKTTTREPAKEPTKATDGAAFKAVLGRGGLAKKGAGTTKGPKGAHGASMEKSGPVRDRRELAIDRDRPKERSPEEPPAARPSMRDRDEAADATEPKKGAGPARPSDADILDPATRQLAQLAPPPGASASAAPQVAHETVMRARSLEELLPALVRKIAWAGDRHRGTVRLELGAGAYAGTTVIVHADRGKVRVETFGEGAETERLRARLDARLRSHGLDVESVT